MITEITISNFRAYSEAVTVRMRPITVLIGQNSAGKSTFIKFLQMLRQTLESAEDSFFVTEGSHVQLGAFRDLKNRNTAKRSVDFRIQIQTDDVPSTSILKTLQKISNGKDKDFDKVFVDIFKSKESVIPDIKKINYDVYGNINYARSQPRGSHKVIMSGTGLPFLTLKTNNIRRSRFLHFPEESDKPEYAIKSYFQNQALEPLRYEFVSTRHLSAIREESERAIIVASPPKDDVGHRGQYAMPHLRKLLELEDANGAGLVLRHAESVAGVADLHFDTAMKGYLGHVKGKNKETGAECHLADFGFGVSQCIPIFVQGALMHKGQLLMVEQPEAHLHPTAQLAMGNFFADLWTQRRVSSLIETHSANVLLRLRRLVKEGVLGSDDVSVAYFYNDAGKVTVKNLDIEIDGSLESGLPMEFFGADIIEAIGMGV